MSRVASSSVSAAARCGWLIQTSQMSPSVASASAAAQRASRRNSSSRNASGLAGCRTRRAAIRPRMSAGLSNGAILVEVARGCSERAEQPAIVREAARHQVDHVAVALDHALHREQAGAEQLGLLALAQAPPHHHVDVAGLVLQRDE